MIIGAHVIINSKNAEADRAFLKSLTLPSVPMPGGLTIYGLPPSEVAIHSSDKNDVHEFFLMCDDVNATIAALQKAGVSTSPIHEASWGRLTTLTLPGGGKLGIYQPKHARPKPHTPQKKKKAVARKPAAKKKSAKKPKSRKPRRR